MDISYQKQSAKAINIYLYEYLKYIQQNKNLDG